MADQKNTATTGRDAPIEDPGREVKVSKEDRAQGVISQRETSIIGNQAVSEEAGLANTGAGRSRMEGAQGSGSTTTGTPGMPGPENNEGTTSGTTGLGVGGTTPNNSPDVNVGAGGAGARPDASDKVER
jgi:hypothetical protein